MEKQHLLTALCLAGAIATSAATVDGIAAKVNNDVITVSEVVSEIRRGGARVAGTDFKAAYSNAVEAAINRRLILRSAADRKLDMPEWVVDNRVREIVKENFGGDMNKLRAALAQSRIDIADWRNQIRDEMIVQTMRFQLVERNIEATPAAMEREYQLHRERYVGEELSTVRVILLRPSSDAKVPSVKARAEDILRRIKNGESFAELAMDYSADSHSEDGGLWKDVKPDEAFRPEIAEEIAKLKVGEHSGLVDLDGWGFIVKKEAETAEKTLSFSEAYDRIVRNVRRDTAAKAYDDWMKRLRAEAFIKTYPMPEK
jgi:parvulin-like peptidyl-prolyl isomerase